MRTQVLPGSPAGCAGHPGEPAGVRGSGVGRREVVLIHAGLGNFSPGNALDDYQLDELILPRPNPGQTYFTDRYLVFGHTPTSYYTGARLEDARIFRKGKLIGIDYGCVSGGPLSCVCLGTLEDIYV